ncbi:RtcB family protein [Geochorda subterranea]
MDRPFRIFGQHDEETLRQMERVATTGPVVDAVLMADGHKGYSMPVGGVVAYDEAVSPVGVGVDIGCGCLAVRTELTYSDLVQLAGEDKTSIKPLVNRIYKSIAFGMGRTNPDPVDSPLFDDPRWEAIPAPVRGSLRNLARQQLGTVGGGNHFVDLLVEESPEGKVWVACHFGSRGFGFKVAHGFLGLHAGLGWEDAVREDMDAPPVVFSLRSSIGQDYWQAMSLAIDYAYAGREYVVGQVLRLLGNPKVLLTVHNNHNDARKEVHNGQEVVVVRKGATPLFPGQLGFVGGSMGDISVIVRGLDTEENELTIRPTVHGAGRVMSRTKAAGKRKKIDGRWMRVGGEVDWEAVRRSLWERGIVVKGGGADEAPAVYRPLSQVLGAYTDSFEVLCTLRPVAVMMAPENEFDPYKD